MGILSVVAQTAAIDCILRLDSPVTVQGQDLPLATVVQWAGRIIPPKKVAADDAINWTRDIFL